MKKILTKTAIYLAFIICQLSFSVALSSCSSDNDELDGTEQINDGRKLRLLNIADVPITRATLTDNSTSLGAMWNAGDEATYFNLTSHLDEDGVLDFGPLSASEATVTSPFTGTVRCKEGDKIALFYPATNPAIQGSDRGTFAINLSGQKGTLADVAKNYHYVYGFAEITSVTESTANALISPMKSLLAVCKFTFNDGTDPIPVKTLSISYYDKIYGDKPGYPQSTLLKLFKTNNEVTSIVGIDEIEVETAYPDPDNTFLTIKLENETSDGVYVALFPVCGENNTKVDFYFSAEGSDGTYTGTARATLKAGKYYPVNLKLNKNN